MNQCLHQQIRFKRQYYTAATIFLYSIYTHAYCLFDSRTIFLSPSSSLYQSHIRWVQSGFQSVAYSPPISFAFSRSSPRYGLTNPLRTKTTPSCSRGNGTQTPEMNPYMSATHNHMVMQHTTQFSTDICSKDCSRTRPFFWAASPTDK